MIYKVSFVVQGDGHPGGIQNLDHHPEVGEILEVGTLRFEITEVTELIPPYGDYTYLHATCRMVEPSHSGKGANGDNA